MLDLTHKAGGIRGKVRKATWARSWGPCNHVQKNLDFILQRSGRHLRCKLWCATDAQVCPFGKITLGAARRLAGTESSRFEGRRAGRKPQHSLL